MLEELGRVEEARKTYEEALKAEQVKKETAMWLLAAKFEERQEMFTRARTILEKIRIKQ